MPMSHHWNLFFILIQHDQLFRLLLQDYLLRPNVKFEICLQLLLKYHHLSFIHLKHFIVVYLEISVILLTFIYDHFSYATFLREVCNHLLRNQVYQVNLIEMSLCLKNYKSRTCCYLFFLRFTVLFLLFFLFVLL